MLIYSFLKNSKNPRTRTIHDSFLLASTALGPSWPGACWVLVKKNPSTRRQHVPKIPASTMLDRLSPSQKYMRMSNSWVLDCSAAVCHLVFICCAECWSYTTPMLDVDVLSAIVLVEEALARGRWQKVMTSRLTGALP